MNCTDYIIPENSSQPWIIIYSSWKKIGELEIERIDVNSAFKPIDVMTRKMFAQEEEFIKELEKQRGDWIACVSMGKQAIRGAAYKFLPKI